MRRKSKFERLSKIQHVVMLDEFLSLRSMRCHAQRDFCRMSVFFVETVAHIDKPFSPSGRSIILVFWPHHHYKSVKGKSLSGDRRRRGCEVWEHKVLRMPQFCVVRPVSGKVSDEKGRNFVKPHKFQQLYRKSGRRESLHANDEGNRFWIRKYI